MESVHTILRIGIIRALYESAGRRSIFSFFDGKTQLCYISCNCLAAIAKTSINEHVCISENVRRRILSVSFTIFSYQVWKQVTVFMCMKTFKANWKFYIPGNATTTNIHLNANETQPFSTHLFSHMDHMRLFSELYPVFLHIEH